MFDKKHIIDHLVFKNDLLKCENTKLIKMIDELKECIENRPTDCTMGEYCGGCQFSRILTVYSSEKNKFISAVVCAKNGICKNYKGRQPD